MCALFNFFLSNVYTFTDVPQKKFTKTLVITAPSPLRYQSEMLYKLDWRDAEMGYSYTGITVLAKITQILYIYIYNGQSTSICTYKCILRPLGAAKCYFLNNILLFGGGRGEFSWDPVSLFLRFYCIFLQQHPLEWSPMPSANHAWTKLLNIRDLTGTEISNLIKP